VVPEVRVAADEHQSQHIVVDMVDRRQEVSFGYIVCLCMSDSGIDLITSLPPPGGRCDREELTRALAFPPRAACR